MAGNFQVSSKLPDGRIFVVAGESFAEFETNLTSAVGQIDAESLLSTMAASLVGTGPTQTSVASAASNVAAAFPGAQVVNAAPSAAAPAGRSCKHGEMTKRTGSGPKGPWKAYMCPSPKGTPDQCEPTWIRRNDPEWNSF